MSCGAKQNTIRNLLRCLGLWYNKFPFCNFQATISGVCVNEMSWSKKASIAIVWNSTLLPSIVNTSLSSTAFPCDRNVLLCGRCEPGRSSFLSFKELRVRSCFLVFKLNFHLNVLVQKYLLSTYTILLISVNYTTGVAKWPPQVRIQSKWCFFCWFSMYLKIFEWSTNRHHLVLNTKMIGNKIAEARRTSIFPRRSSPKRFSSFSVRAGKWERGRHRCLTSSYLRTRLANSGRLTLLLFRKLHRWGLVG